MALGEQNMERRNGIIKSNQPEQWRRSTDYGVNTMF
jgi:hypothetical protein